jgi:organic radical activating enzyme
VEIFCQYKTGDVIVELLNDGTKIRTILGPVPPEHPETIDIKITDYCDMGCAWCHESSTKKGKHGNLEVLLQKLSALPEGVELAIGGGDPLSHPDAEQFLLEVKQITNLTINGGHIGDYLSRIKGLPVKGVGVSYNSTKKIKEHEIREICNSKKHFVFHIILGITPLSDIKELLEFGAKRILLLGYKDFGFGVKYKSQKMEQIIKRNIAEVADNISLISKNNILSFDNLAIEQLHMQKRLSEKDWGIYYMGDDFSYSMYIDAVKGEFSPTSRDKSRTSWSEIEISEFFKKNRTKQEWENEK